MKWAAEKVFARSSLLSTLTRRRSRDVLILAYHNIVPRGQERCKGDASLHLDHEEFARQLDTIQQTYTVVPLTSIFDCAKAGEPLRVAITFDDAYEGAVTVGVAELVSRGLPATIFVAPGLIGQQTWWDVLAAQGLLSPDARRFALETLTGDRERVISWAAQSRRQDRVSTFRIGTEHEISAAADCAGISLGSHTWSHRNLCALDSSEMQRELTRPLAWLSERWGARAWALSYPYGMSSPQVERAAADTGYKTAFRVDGGALRATAAVRPYAVPRLNIPAGISIDGFRLRLTGLYSLLA
jgi:peptidoglycan/xylan/chitin deacetylase (PgdA/CDA1 family)